MVRQVQVLIMPEAGENLVNDHESSQPMSQKAGTKSANGASRLASLNMCSTPKSDVKEAMLLVNTSNYPKEAVSNRTKCKMHCSLWAKLERLLAKPQREIQMGRPKKTRRQMGMPSCTMKKWYGPKPNIFEDGPRERRWHICKFYTEGGPQAKPVNHRRRRRLLCRPMCSDGQAGMCGVMDRNKMVFANAISLLRASATASRSGALQC